MSSLARSLELVALDVRYACRRLIKHRAFTIVACSSLALGIGANTAAFGVLHAVLLRDLPVSDPSTLAVVSMRHTGFQYSMSYPAFTHLRDHTAGLGGVLAFRAQALNVNAGERTERLTGMLVSGGYFDLLGVPMALGTGIGPEDDRTPRSGGPRGLVAVVSHDFWTRRLHADVGAIGRPLRVDGRLVTIVGVAPPGFHGTRVGSMPDIYVPMMFSANIFGDTWLTNPRNNWLRLIARRRAGTSVDQTEAQLTAAFRQFNRDIILPLATTDAQRQRSRDGRIVLEPGASGLLEMGNTVRPSLYALMALVTLVLLIACVNVATLMIARAERASRDVAIARSLGASAARLWSQQVVEAGLLAAVSVVLGLVVAVWMRPLLMQLLPANQQIDFRMDSRVWLTSVAAGIGTAILLGSATAWQSGRMGLLGALKGADPSARLSLRKGLIVGQLALAVVVLMAAALFTQTLVQLRRVDPGFDREHILIATVSPRSLTRDEQRTLQARLLEEVRAIPGVASAALADHEPLAANTFWNLQVEHDARGATQAQASIAFVSPDYFETLGIRLLRGRDFTPQDESDPLRAVIVNENFAQRYFTGRDPVGGRFRGNGLMEFEIVGLVRDNASVGLRDRDQQMIYVPRSGNVLHVRAAVPPVTLRSTIEAVVRRIDSDLPMHDVRTIDQQLDRFVARERTFAQLSSTFGLVALVLSALGLYGVMANAVSRRTKELGIRIALGAAPGRIVQFVLREAGVLVVVGLAVGVPSAFAMGRAMASMLYGVTPGDWRSVTVAVVVLAAVAVASAWIPARRAGRVDPVSALRSE
jgi:predicted permease